MQLLIVHDDVEVGEQLVTMLKEYTTHRCDLVQSEAAARHWAEKHARCDLLLVQLKGNAVDRLDLAGSLSDPFAGLQTFFLPSYPATLEQVAIPKTKVFPEPINGERLLDAIEHVANGGPGPDLFDVRDLLQMCCLSKLDGAVQLVQQNRVAVIYLRAGTLVHVESATAGPESVSEVLSWGLVEFAYDASARAPETMCVPWDKVIVHPAAGPEEKKDEPSETKLAEPNRVPEVQKRRGFLGLFRRS